MTDTLPTTPPDLANLEPDVVEALMQRVIALAPALEAAIRAQGDAVYQEYGGQRLYVPKRSALDAERKRAQVYRDGLANMPEAELLAKHKISRATLYRTMKRGGRFGG